MFEWEDFLDLADALATDSEDEASFRTAISRAYYAAFHAGRNCLVRSDIPLDRSGKAHLQVQQRFRSVNQTISEDFERLHNWRKVADYDNPGFADSAMQARSAVDLAREFIVSVNSIVVTRDDG